VAQVGLIRSLRNLRPAARGGIAVFGVWAFFLVTGRMGIDFGEHWDEWYQVEGVRELQRRGHAGHRRRADPAVHRVPDHQRAGGAGALAACAASSVPAHVAAERERAPRNLTRP